MVVQKKLKYPKSIFFIVSNEFCERFSFYGMRTVLMLYLRNQLKYSDDTSTVIYHTFTMFVYFFPIFGAILADSWLGKFRTIFYVSIIYTCGQLLLSASAAPFGLAAREFSILGLLLIALGTGGIKPCVSAFGGDQFILPQQERYLSTFFSLFYFSINSGSLISTFLTPLLRSNFTCFGETSCYSLAFFVPAVLMTASIVIFVMGKPLYRIVEPTGNIMLDVTKCVSHGVYNKIRSKGVKRDHWLDHADDKYESKLIEDIKAALQVLKMFLPLPVFWALFDQQGSRWTIQATRMNGEIGNFLIQPDQMQIFNPLFVLALIPVFETVIYPLLAKINMSTPLKKLTLGGLLAALAFVISALVELQLEKTYPVLPSNGVAQVRVFNTMNCPIQMNVEKEEFLLTKMGMWKIGDVKATGNVSLNYNADFSECHSAGFTNLQGKVSGSIPAVEAMAVSVVATPQGLSYNYVDAIDKSRSGNPLIRALIYADPSNTNGSLELVKDGKTAHNFTISNDDFMRTDLAEVQPGKYDILVNSVKVQTDVPMKLGGVYTVVGFDLPSTTQKSVTSTLTVTEPNSLHILWLVPQYLVITMGEVMFSVTGLEFAFTQAPSSMKSLLQGGWLLAVAFGNIIVAVVAELSVFKRQTNEFLMFAGLMFVDILIFAIMAKFYKYVEPVDTETDEINMEMKNGNVNPSFKHDEK